MSPLYAVIFTNLSTNPGPVCLFQQGAEVGVEGAMSVGWLAHYADPGVGVRFQWNPEIDFVWTTALGGDAPVIASQVVAAGTANRIGLTYDPKQDAYVFANLRRGAGPGWHISQNGTVPLRQAWVGIGMAGAATYLAPTQPNLSLDFTAPSTYWIAFGDCAAGVPVDPATLARAAPLVFPPNVYTVTASIGPDNTWTVAAGVLSPNTSAP